MSASPGPSAAPRTRPAVSASSISPPDSDRETASALLATLSSDAPRTLSDPAQEFRQMVDEYLAGSSGASDTVADALRSPGSRAALGAESCDISSFDSLLPGDLSPAADYSRVSSSPMKHDDSPPESSRRSGPIGQIRQMNAPHAVSIHEGEPLAVYSCPICFSPPSYAAMTPCGHLLCGECLFTAVKTTIQRGAYTLPPGERMIARYAHLSVASDP